jgi:hypothetical protein
VRIFVCFLRGSRTERSLTLHNLAVSGKSVSFDWKDPDGDENHWKTELTGTVQGG